MSSPEQSANILSAQAPADEAGAGGTVSAPPYPQPPSSLRLIPFRLSLSLFSPALATPAFYLSKTLLPFLSPASVCPSCTRTLPVSDAVPASGNARLYFSFLLLPEPAPLMPLSLPLSAPATAPTAPPCRPLHPPFCTDPLTHSHLSPLLSAPFRLPINPPPLSLHSLRPSLPHQGCTSCLSLTATEFHRCIVGFHSLICLNSVRWKQ